MHCGGYLRGEEARLYGCMHGQGWALLPPPLPGIVAWHAAHTPLMAASSRVALAWGFVRSVCMCFKCLASGIVRTALTHSSEAYAQLGNSHINFKFCMTTMAQCNKTPGNPGQYLEGYAVQGIYHVIFISCTTGTYKCQI